MVATVQPTLLNPSLIFIVVAHKNSRSPAPINSIHAMVT